jgi:hypothetical protein
LLAELAALKEQYEAVTGEPYPAGGRAPKKKKGAAAAAAVPTASGALNCGACQPWWDGAAVPESLVAKMLAETGLSSDSAQGVSPDEEAASWCTSLLVKCKKKKQIYMITSAPGHKPDLKKIAGAVGAKELRLVSSDADKAHLKLPVKCTSGCVTAMSVIGARHHTGCCRAVLLRVGSPAVHLNTKPALFCALFCQC